MHGCESRIIDLRMFDPFFFLPIRLSAVQVPREAGMFPVSWLPYISRFSMPDKLPSSVGIEPDT